MKSVLFLNLCFEILNNLAALFFVAFLIFLLDFFVVNLHK